MIELIATVESIQQAEALLAAGVDILYFGEDTFGLRLPHSFTRSEQEQITQMAHKAGKKVSVALNAIFHNEDIDLVPEYLEFLKDIQVDTVTLGDPGVIQKMRKHDLEIPYRYDAQVLVTSSGQVNFWADRGAVAGVLAREIPEAELEEIAQKAKVPVEVLVYGASCIHQSRRNLLENYFNYIQKEEEVGRKRGLFIADPLRKDSHYSIYEDANGTHIFATNDISLVEHLGRLGEMGVSQWKLEGLFIEPDNFVKIAECFNEMRNAVQTGAWTTDLAQAFKKDIEALHPSERQLDTGFYLKDPAELT